MSQIQRMIDQNLGGGVVDLENCQYELDEPLKIQLKGTTERWLHLRGNGARLMATTSMDYLLLAARSNLIISGLELRAANNADVNEELIRIGKPFHEHVTNLTVENCIFQRFNKYGIRIHSGEIVNVRNCMFSGNHSSPMCAVRLENDPNNVLTIRNIILESLNFRRDSRDDEFRTHSGIFIKGRPDLQPWGNVYNVLVRNCYLKDVRYFAVHVENAFNVNIDRCYLEEATEEESSLVHIENGGNHIISQCTFDVSSRYLLFFKNGGDAELRRNLVTGSYNNGRFGGVREIGFSSGRTENWYGADNRHWQYS